MTTELIQNAAAPPAVIGEEFSSSLVTVKPAEARPTDAMTQWAERKVAELLASLAPIMPGGILDTKNLPHMKAPSGGAVTWEVPPVLDHLIGGGQGATKEFSGVLLFQRAVRVYYARSMDEQAAAGAEGADKRPDCRSDDLIHGTGDISGNRGAKVRRECEACPMNQWGTDPKTGKGKACKEKVIAFVLVPGVTLPIVVSASTGSLENLRKYLVGHALLGNQFSQVMTGFGLERVEGQLPYSRIRFATKGELAPADKAYAKALADALAPILRHARIEDDGGGDAAGGPVETQASAAPVDPAAEAEKFKQDFGLEDPAPAAEPAPAKGKAKK